MLEELYSRKSFKTLARIRCCWLRQPIADYLEKLLSQGYKRAGLKVTAHDLIWFADFVARQGDREIANLPRWIEPFLKQLTPRKDGNGTWRSIINRFVDHLMREGQIPKVTEAGNERLHAGMIEEYLLFVNQHRGVSREHVKNIRRFFDAFFDFLVCRGVVELQDIRPDVIHDFIIADGSRYHRTTISARCSMLRRFLSHLHRQSLVGRDLAQAVMSPRVYRQEQCPRFLTLAEVKLVLAAVDRDTDCGKRDYAMILLLAVYGLRGIEVIRLRLDDIDWRRQRLQVIRRKAGNTTTYPLATAVGDAILEYLKNARSASPHRQVFLSSKAPFHPVAWTAQLGVSVRKHMAKAGIQVERPGTHTFRYSCAQRLFEQDMPLKFIGDYLGHRDTDSTQRYTKIALEQLREVAIGDGEDLL